MSLLLEFLPKLSTWFHSLTSDGRRYVVLGFNAILAGVVALVTCHSGYVIPVEGVVCGGVDQTIVNGLLVFVMSMLGSQGAHYLKRAGA